MGILFYYGMDKVLAQLANQKRTFVLNWPEWIFWSLCTDRTGVHDSSFYRVLSRCVYEKGGQING